MVVLYDNLEIQMPTDLGNEDYIYVKNDGNLYTISSCKESVKTFKNNKKKTAELAEQNLDSDKEENIVVQ